MDVHLRDLRYFVAVAEELHFTRAAEREFVSQPVLSRQIARLEADLRITLLERTRRTVSLTPAGVELLEHARRLLQAWDTAQRATSDASAAAEATLRIGMQTSIGRGLLEDFVTRFKQRRPNWSIEVTQINWDDPTAGVRSSNTDIGFCWLPLPDPDPYETIIVATELRLLAVSSNHELARQTAVDFAEIEHLPLIALPATAGVLRDHWLAQDHRSTPANVCSTATNAESALELVANGIGSVLIAAGNAEIYNRPGISYITVNGISNSNLAVIWRRDDHRTVIRDIADIVIGSADP